MNTPELTVEHIRRPHSLLDASLAVRGFAARPAVWALPAPMVCTLIDVRPGSIPTTPT